MSKPFVVSEQELSRHISALGSIIGQSVSSGIFPQVVLTGDGARLWASLIGRGCEIIARNRGSDIYVAPLLLLDDGMWAWIGLFQEWASERSAGRTARFSYRSTSLSVHLGFLNLRHKPQIYRAEWSGWADWYGRGFGPQAGNAAHPHWQFDVLESLRRDGARQLARTYLAVLRTEAEGVEPQVFSPRRVETSEIDEIVGSKDFGRMHFASAAAWWRSAPYDLHAHFPSSRSDVEAWVRKTIDYTVEELERLQ